MAFRNWLQCTVKAQWQALKTKSQAEKSVLFRLDSLIRLECAHFIHYNVLIHSIDISLWNVFIPLFSHAFNYTSKAFVCACNFSKLRPIILHHALHLEEEKNGSLEWVVLEVQAA